VKIAVLDSGIALQNSRPELVKEMRASIKPGKPLKKTLPPWHDAHGHGTHTAGLLLMVCPYAEIYVYRIIEDPEDIAGHQDFIDRNLAADAIFDAIDKKVDIVSMSFGWSTHTHDKLHKPIKRANDIGILLFAASSNGGVGGEMSYPARADEVFAIDAADGFGSSSRFNTPPGSSYTCRFTALGDAVRSAYPVHRGVMPGEEKPGWRRMSGTSCATPIAAGIAALVLEFARQPPLCYDTFIEKHLKTVTGMREVLKLHLSKPSGRTSFPYLDPMILFHCTNKYQDGGEWWKHDSPRFHAAMLIIKCLQSQYNESIGELIGQKLEEELSGRGGVRSVESEAHG
jgi:subtilisin family serine protease